MSDLESPAEPTVDGSLRPEPRSYHPQPAQKPGLSAYRVKDELVLLPDQGDKVYALNSTGAAIWRLCDGKRTLPDIFSALRSDFQGEDLQIMADLNAAILQFREMNLLEPSSLSDPRSSQAGFVSPAAAEADRRRVRILHGIEDRPYFHWQLAIMFESLIGQLPPGWDVVIVVCNNHQTLTPELEKILDTYAIEHFTGDSPADNYDIDFADGGDRYVPMNRVEALNVIRHHVGPDDLVCLMDTDIFLYGELQASLFPKSNAMASNWIIGQDRYYHFSTKNERGLSLPKLLEALGYEEQFKPGGVIVFLTGDALQAKDGKLVKDCFRFLQILYLAAKILELPPHGVWVAEMACFALAMYPSGIDYELLDIEQFDVQDPGASELPQGSFCHYYADKAEGNGGPFAESEWHKQLYTEQNFLVADIKSFLDRAQGPVEKRFMELALMAKERLYGKQRD